MKRTGAIRIIFAAVVLIAPACDESTNVDGDRDQASAEIGQPSDVAIWGCGHAITGLDKHPDPQWRDEAIVVGDFGFFGMAGDFSGHRAHRRSDIQVKLPIIIEGRSSVVLWLPRDERDRAGLILSDVPRHGPGNSYRVEDGHPGIRFEPCPDREWSAWTAGLALADRGEVTLMVQEDAASRATPVMLGPWEVQIAYRRTTG